MTAEILLLPGTLCDNDLLWRDVRGGLEQFGQVKDVALTEPSIDGMVEQVVDRASGGVILVGFSLGGIVAMAVHRQQPDLVRGMALICTTARPPRPEQHQTWQHLVALAATDFDTAVDQVVASMPFVGTGAADKEATAREMAERVGSTAFRAQLRAQQTRVDERPGIANCGVPILVAPADQDDVCPRHLSEEIAALSDHSELRVIEECGHLAPLDKPDEITRLLQDWLPGAIGEHVRPGLAGDRNDRPSRLESME